MKKNYFFASVLALGMSLTSIAQTRYIDEVFTDVSVTSDVMYGANITHLPFLFGGTEPELDTLDMDIYQPVGDTLSERPVFIYLHTGNFLPRLVNNSLVGTKSDSSAVEICTRLAKRGYVVASIDYRLFWNPGAPTQEDKTKFLLQAVYRAFQDGKTAVRFLRKDVAENGNTYAIDPGKIAVFGEGSGAYVAQAMATINDVSEIQLPKFLDVTDPANPVPFVDTNIFGNFETGGGVSSHNIENHPGYSSSISFCVNLGGAMGDISWLEQGDVPMVAFHCENDPFAPYAEGTVIVPTTGDPVVAVSGSYSVLEQANIFGNNSMLSDPSPIDVYSTQANANNDGSQGLYPFVTDSLEAAPWQWWGPTEFPHGVNPQLTYLVDSLHLQGLNFNHNMSNLKAMLYIDTIMGYMLPRALDGFVNHTHIPTSINELVEGTVSVYPNPANAILNIESSNEISTIQIYNMTGSLVFSRDVINSTRFEINNTTFPSGIYFLEVNTTKGVEVHKVIFE